jgi:Zn finger protein HypA/HybF involved in hydrogenase expression
MQSGGNMAVCKKCKIEYTSLKETSDICPACKTKNVKIKPDLLQDKHLQEKQKRFSSE